MGGTCVMFETIILPILTLLLSGGLATFITLKATKRTADANADQAEVQTRADEFHLLKEQIELNQEQNLTLTKTNLELTEHIKDKAKKYSAQTEILRKAQADLLKAEEDKMRLVAENGDLKVELAKKKCEDIPCPFRLPPNAYTTPTKGETKESYVKRTRKAVPAKRKNKDNGNDKEELQK